MKRGVSFECIQAAASRPAIPSLRSVVTGPPRQARHRRGWRAGNDHPVAVRDPGEDFDAAFPAGAEGDKRGAGAIILNGEDRLQLAVNPNGGGGHRDSVAFFPRQADAAGHAGTEARFIGKIDADGGGPVLGVERRQDLADRELRGIVDFHGNAATGFDLLEERLFDGNLQAVISRFFEHDDGHAGTGEGTRFRFAFEDDAGERSGDGAVGLLELSAADGFVGLNDSLARLVLAGLGHLNLRLGEAEPGLRFVKLLFGDGFAVRRSCIRRKVARARDAWALAETMAASVSGSAARASFGPLRLGGWRFRFRERQ